MEHAGRKTTHKKFMVELNCLLRHLGEVTRFSACLTSHEKQLLSCFTIVLTMCFAIASDAVQRVRKHCTRARYLSCEQSGSHQSARHSFLAPGRELPIHLVLGHQQ